MNLTGEAVALLARAGEAGLTLADAAAALRDLIPADVLARTQARLERADGTCSDPARRVVQDTLNRLVTKRTVEAAGEGDARRYRLTPESRTVIARPKPRRETIPLEHLTFDRACQQRADGLFDEATVERYLELHRDERVTFPPIEVVWDGKAGTNWVFGGFHRGEMLRRAGASSAECLVYDGTKQDAILYSLAENASHGRNRTAGDVQRALATVLDNNDIRARVLETARDEGGVHRAIRAACGVSKGAVYIALKARGLKASRAGTLTKADPAPADPKPTAPTPSPARAETPREPAPDPNDELPPAGGGVPDHVRAALATRRQWDTTIATLTEAMRQLDAVCRSNAAAWVRAVLAEDGEAVIRTATATKGGQASPVWTVPALVGLIRLLKRGRPSRACAGCNGKGCRECRDNGFIPESKSLMPTAGETGDLFEVGNVGDVWA